MMVVELTRFRGQAMICEKESPMPKSHPPYPAEYRQHIVELVRSGRTPEDLAREFEPTAQCIRDWVKAAERPDGVRADGVTHIEHEELKRLRREVKILRQEKEILKKAAAWFARESTLPFKGRYRRR